MARSAFLNNSSASAPSSGYTAMPMLGVAYIDARIN
jgi:hypothetical protein